LITGNQEILDVNGKGIKQILLGLCLLWTIVTCATVTTVTVKKITYQNYG